MATDQSRYIEVMTSLSNAGIIDMDLETILRNSMYLREDSTDQQAERQNELDDIQQVLDMADETITRTKRFLKELEGMGI